MWIDKKNANIPVIRFEKHDNEFDGTDRIDSNYRKEIKECKLLVIKSELTISRYNKIHINSDKSKKAIPNRKSARDIGNDPKNSINRDKAPDGRTIIINNEIGNSKGIYNEKKFKYCHEYKFYDEKSCCNKSLACDYSGGN
ncbi:hypothetical protein F8M41_021923 [Gigaspora margarita]|uniref:Uncharacterized protein n=1 Tax=Gigaspora margarita TaxID=4874 RepID=A0A8H4ETW9_GIGMA|nr:hypothetical protein F8M41_021923 [Gigaspora margarita]